MPSRPEFRRGLAGLLLLLAVCPVIADGGRTVIDELPGTGLSVSSAWVPATGGQGGFYLTVTEIPWDLFDLFVYRLHPGDPKTREVDAETRPTEPYYLPDEGFGHKGHPALAMTQRNAEAFAAWLSEKTGRRFRLPAEAEWEHACVTGTPAAPEPLADHAWHRANAQGKTGRVGALKPDALGLHDMLGNVAELVVAADGRPAIRGGSFRSAADGLDCSWRQRYRSSWNASDPQYPKSRWWYADGSFIGFRLLREAD